MIIVSPKIALQLVNCVVTNAVHAELAKFVDLHSLGVVGKQLDMVLNFDDYLKTLDLQKTNALVEEFLGIGGTWK